MSKRVMLTLTASAIGVLGLAAPAAAAPTAAAPGDPAPACVATSVAGNRVTIRNNCTTTQRLTVTVNSTIRTACTAYAVGATRIISSAQPITSVRVTQC
jgi:hypothetical protein